MLKINIIKKNYFLLIQVSCKKIITIAKVYIYIIQSEINKIIIFSIHQTQLIENKTKLHKTQIIQFFVNIKF